MNLLLLAFLGILVSSCRANDAALAAEQFFARNHGTVSSSNHTNNWAVLVSASRYWFNYRHMSNAIAMYRTVKRLGIPDSNIILMLADDTACNARNHFPGGVYAGSGHKIDLYGDNIEVDYRGYEVTVENFIRLLTGRMDSSVPRTKRLLSDASSNVFVYMTGHGGNEFLKFQDNEEISAFDIADTFEQMWQKRRYNELLFMIDTCQANTMYSKMYSPNILATGSSELSENSYSYENDHDVGVAVIDRFTHHVLQFAEGINKTSHASMKDLFDTYSYQAIRSTAGIRSDLFNRPLNEVRITDFLGGVAHADVISTPSDVFDLDTSQENGESQPAFPSTMQRESPAVPNRSATLQKQFAGLQTGDQDHEEGRWWKAPLVRTWSSLAIVGSLLAWVAVSR